MGNPVIRWPVQKLVETIVAILENKFDCFIIIEGNRGLGKSTLAIHLARKVAKKFKIKNSKDYKFHWKNSLIYTKKETKNFWHKWNSLGIADEMINVTFNRDFYNTEQKDIIKMINMNRDHCNLFIACVPQFQTLDSQIKNLCKIRITVVRRGLAIIQTPIQSIYIKDRWDQQSNEKMERTWIQRGSKHPQYSRLSTFKGFLKFPALREKSEKQYQKVKDDKRNLVAKEDMKIGGEKKEESNPLKLMTEMLKAGKVRNGVYMDGFAVANGYKPTSFRDQVIKILKNNGDPYSLPLYFWDKKAKEKKVGSI